MWIDPSTGEVARLHSDLRRMRPNWGAGLVITDDHIAAIDPPVVPVVQVAPIYDPLTQLATELVPALVDGVWTQIWEVTNLPAEDATSKLQAARRAKELEINAWRAAANLTTFPYSGKLVACDALSRSDIDGVANHINLLGTFPPDFPGGWLATDNSYIPLPTVEDFKSLYSAMAKQGTANFARSQALKARVRTATTSEAIASINWLEQEE